MSRPSLERETLCAPRKRVSHGDTRWRGGAQIADRVARVVFAACGVFTVGILVLILGFLLQEAWPAIRAIGLGEILFGERWNPGSLVEPGYGALPLVLGTLMVTAGALVIAVPWGLGVASYLSDVARPRVREILKPVIELLALFPSVVIGFIALVIVAPAVARVFGLSSGLNALTGALALAVMALPTVISIAEDALGAVSRDYREAAYALGATRWQTLRYVVLPAAASGIVAAVMLGFGRAVGETMTVLMATGNAVSIPLTEVAGIPVPDFLASVRTLTATLAAEGLEVPWGSLHWHALFVLAMILFFFTFVVNLVADLILQRYRTDREGS